MCARLSFYECSLLVLFLFCVVCIGCVFCVACVCLCVCLFVFVCFRVFVCSVRAMFYLHVCALFRVPYVSYYV